MFYLKSYKNVENSTFPPQHISEFHIKMVTFPLRKSLSNTSMPARFITSS